MSRIPVEDAIMELERTKAYLRERLPADFKVKDKGLAEITTLGTEIQTGIQDEISTGEVHEKSRVHRNSKINELYDFQVDCRRIVAVEYDTDSPEYQGIPWNDPEGSNTKKPGEQPEQNQ